MKSMAAAVSLTRRCPMETRKPSAVRASGRDDGLVPAKSYCDARTLLEVRRSTSQRAAEPHPPPSHCLKRQPGCAVARKPTIRRSRRSADGHSTTDFSTCPLPSTSISAVTALRLSSGAEEPQAAESVAASAQARRLAAAGKAAAGMTTASCHPTRAVRPIGGGDTVTGMSRRTVRRVCGAR